MEIPQQQRLFEAEGRKPTHDFLSLYSTGQQDPRPTSQGSLRTHDFLLPLERVEDGGGAAKEENPVEISSSVEKSSPTSGEHILPGGIGTYSISHISYYNQRVPKSEGSPTIFTVAQTSSTDKNEEHSNCSSYTGSGFTLWEESALKKGKTGKENVGERSNNYCGRDATPKIGAHWTTTPERLSQLSTNNQYSSFSSLSSSQATGQKSQSFMEMIQSAKGCSQDDNLDEEDEFVLKKESPSPIHKGELRVKVDGKSTDQKANTPRSKHSATEQRRRSKINDRFQMLRELIPHGDQKRDKASFLLEVIEYVQFLQEKVQKYEGSYQAWNQEPPKLMPWKNGNRPGESYVDQSRGINGAAAPTLLFSPNLDEKSIALSPSVTGGAHNAVESERDSATILKALDHHHGKAMPFFSSGKTSGAVGQIAPRIILDDENMATQSQSHHTRSCSSGAFAVAGDNKLKEQELTIEGGTINISSVYSQGLLNTLTQALQSTGVDLSGASISVQIDLGKQASRRPSIPTSIVKGNKVASSNQGVIRTRVSSAEESNNQAQKKLKTSRVP